MCNSMSWWVEGSLTVLYTLRVAAICTFWKVNAVYVHQLSVHMCSWGCSHAFGLIKTLWCPRPIPIHRLVEHSRNSTVYKKKNTCSIYCTNSAYIQIDQRSFYQSSLLVLWLGDVICHGDITESIDYYACTVGLHDAKQWFIIGFQVKVSYPSKTSHFAVDRLQVRQAIAKLAAGNISGAIKNLYQIDEVKASIHRLVEQTVSSECDELCSTSRPSLFRQNNAEDVVNLKAQDLLREAEERAPSFHAMVKAMVQASPQNTKSNPEKMVPPMSLILKGRNKQTGAVACQNGLILHQCGLSSRVSMINDATCSVRVLFLLNSESGTVLLCSKHDQLLAIECLYVDWSGKPIDLNSCYFSPTMGSINCKSSHIN